MTTFTTGKTAFTALTLMWAGSIGAHHSESMFAPTPLWVKGQVVEFSRVNPHAVVVLEEVGSGGQTRRWAVEGRSLAQLNGMGIGPDFLVAGDQIEFCAFPRRQASTSRPEGAPPFVHGLVLVHQDGEMLMWGTYGKLTNCVRPEDQGEIWVDFLRSEDPFFSEWCWKSVEIPTRDESKALVGEINGLLGNPCK